MKKILSLLCLGALALDLTACKSISTRSVTHFYNDAGQELAKRTEHTHSTGFFVKGESVAIKGTLTFTNTIVMTNATVSLGEQKNFSADKVSSQADAEGINATGTAVGNVAGTILKKAATGN